MTKKMDYIDIAFIMKELATLKQAVKDIWEEINDIGDRIEDLETSTET